MSGVLNLLLAGAASAIKDAYFNLTTLLLNTSSTNGAQNNTFLDSSTNNFTITRNGNTTQGTFTPFSQTGWSNYFNGSSNLATVANPNLAFGTGDITCEFWMNTFSNSDNGLCGTTNEAAWNSNSWSFKYSASAIVLYNGNSGGDLWSISTGTLHDGAWHHVAIVRSSGTWQVFVDGVSKGTTTTQGTRSLGDNSWRFAVGSIEPSNSDLKYTGYLSNFRLNNTALYSSNFTPSTTPLTAVTGTKLLTCQSNRFLDNSSSAIALTVGSAPSVQAFSPFAPTAAYDTAVVGGSGYFDGSGDYLNFTDSANDLDLGGRVASIEAWVYPIATSGVQHFIFKSGGGTDWNTSNGVHYAIAFDTNKFYFVYNVSGGATFINGATTRSPRQWYHVVIATDASNNIALFVNGVRDGTATNAITKPTTRTSVYVGTNNSGTEAITGYISGKRFIAGSGAYDPTQTTLTIPTAPPTAVTNTKLLLNYTNAGIYDSASKNVLETVGNAQVSTTQAKWGTTSMYFDGTGDSLKGKLNNAIGGGDYTIEGWLYTGASGARYVFDMRETSQYLGAFTVGTTLYVNIGTTLDIVATTSYPQNTWVHFAMVRSGSASNNTSIFLGGSRVTQVTDTTNYSIVPTLYVGNDNTSSYSWDGYIDDFRITKGYARYSGSTYTPPTAAFSLQ